MTLAFHDPVPTTTNWALDDELLLDAPLPDPLLPDPEPDPRCPTRPHPHPHPRTHRNPKCLFLTRRAAAVELVEAVTFCPTVRLTEATIPSIGEASVAEFSAVWASLTSAWATAIAA